MGLLLWPLAVIILAIWSVLAWIAYSLSEGIAALLASTVSSLLSTDFGPWVAWALASLGGIVQIAVIGAWLLGAIAILAAPWLLRRRRKQSPAPFAHGQHNPFPSPQHHRTDPVFGARDWRNKAAWQQQLRSGGADLRDLRHIADDMVRKYRDQPWNKKSRKGRRKDDDD